MTATITVQQLNELKTRGETVELIDVRTPAEFGEMHIEFARNVPLEGLDPQQIAAQHNGTTAPLYVTCRSGSRGQQACTKLADHLSVINVEGGTLAWEQAGLPLVRGRKAISLERQVRIVAGLLVLIGSLLAYFVHPYFLAVPAFIGAGLTFAGVTDTCGMGLMLARMPWNQVSRPSEQAPQKAACRIPQKNA